MNYYQVHIAALAAAIVALAVGLFLMTWTKVEPSAQDGMWVDGKSSVCKTVTLQGGYCLAPGTYRHDRLGSTFTVHGRVTYTEDAIIVEAAK